MQGNRPNAKKRKSKTKILAEKLFFTYLHSKNFLEQFRNMYMKMTKTGRKKLSRTRYTKDVAEIPYGARDRTDQLVISSDGLIHFATIEYSVS